jgi:hypothetical protein
MLDKVELCQTGGSQRGCSKEFRRDHGLVQAGALPLFLESRKRPILLSLFAFRTENRCALFLEML